MIKEINDFGQKIGGAKKDLWKGRSLSIEDITSFDAIDIKTFVKKDQVWPKPKYETINKPKLIVYYMKKVRDSLPATVKTATMDDATNYINSINYVKEYVESLSSENDLNNSLLNKMIDDGIFKLSYHTVYLENKNYSFLYDRKFIRSIQASKRELENKIKKDKFLYSEEEKILSDYGIYRYSSTNHTWSKDYNNRKVLARKEGTATYYYYPENDIRWINNTFYIIKENGYYGRAIIKENLESEEEAKKFILDYNATQISPAKSVEKKRKTKYKNKSLENLERKGLKSLSAERNIEGSDFLALGIKGGEFGNWENNDERQKNLNYAYTAFEDLATALNIDKKSISLNGELSIAFGARGAGNALAHYEPLRKVINLTKFKGAGSLAHEWGHALDFILSENKEIERIINDFKYCSLKYYNGHPTDFYKNSERMDNVHSKCSNGYWASSTELFARAFACYVSDKLAEKGFINDYLCGHSEDAVSLDNQGMFKAIPEGEERLRINKDFDKLFLKLKKYL